MIGKRCQLSEEARKRGLKMSHFRKGQLLKYVGKVVGESEDKTRWIVKWDQLKYPRHLEKVMIVEEGR